MHRLSGTDADQAGHGGDENHPARNLPERLVTTVGAGISLTCVVLLVILLLS